MSNILCDTVKDKLFYMVTERNLGSGYRTCSITTFGLRYLFLTDRIDIIKKFTIQFGCGVLGY
ncbi:MAG TPA: hypothetical protein VH797_06970 [Nitrososphaeraceae archaeon]|jgi:hypothetical protein